MSNLTMMLVKPLMALWEPVTQLQNAQTKVVKKEVTVLLDLEFVVLVSIFLNIDILWPHPLLCVNALSTYKVSTYSE